MDPTSCPPGKTADLQAHQQALATLLAELDRLCRELDIPYFLFAGTLLGAVRHRGFIPWDDDLDVIMLRSDYERFLKAAPAVLNAERFYLQGEFSHRWPMFFSKLRLNGTTCLEPYHPKDEQCHQGVYIDIFPCDNAYESPLGRKLQFYASKVIIAKGLYRRGYETDSAKKKLFMQLCRLLPGKPFHRLVKGPKRTGTFVHSFLGGSARFEKSVYPAACFAGAVMQTFGSGEYPAPVGFDPLLKILYGDYMRIPPEEDRKCKRHTVLVDLSRSWQEYAHYRDGMEFEFVTRSIR